jgi:hypothetical protein
MKIASLSALLRDRERLDGLLHEVHVVCACVWLIGASGPISVVEFAGIPLWVCFLLRALISRRLWVRPFLEPLTWLLAVWAVWQAVSLLWTPDVEQGLDELGAMRFLWSIWMLYPVLDRRRVLIGAYAVGFLLGNAAQVIHYFAPEAIWHRQPHRFSGWWAPVAGGVILCSALGLHLPAAFMGRGRERALGAAGAAASAFGILLTGTRGAWLAGTALAALTGALTLWRLGRQAPRSAAIGIAVTLAGVGATWLIAGDSIRSRFDSAVAEIRGAIENKDFASDTGARLLMNWCALQAFERHPVAGIGAGGYHDWVIDNLDMTGVDPARIHAQAHSSPLHIAATNGAIGLLLTGSIIAVALRQARARVHGGSPDGWGTYDAGPLFALLGLVLASATNTIHISAQASAHLAILFSLCPQIPRKTDPGDPSA